MAIRRSYAALAALLLMGTAGLAHAQTAPAAPAASSPNPNLTLVSDPGPFTLTAPHKTLQWDSKGRWGLRLDMEQPINRDMGWKDVEAGAYFKITPSLRIGGSVGLGDKMSNPQQILPQDVTGPRVHLETKFKF